ncbi:hypothetical protein PG999_002382 [Apiospora kogelbergensis]|uniref:Uncharacterized protein n=1 Tax=Apiospora kogelbergensis TaxID=1337665 RepID=A0AAW0R810_9PEZI
MCDSPSPPTVSQPNGRNDSFRSQGKRPTWTDSFKLIHRGSRTPSFQAQAAKAARDAQKPKRYPQIVSVYGGLTWEMLRKFLLEKWPEEDFSQEPSRKRDHWQFETPEDFTEVSSQPSVWEKALLIEGNQQEDKQAIKDLTKPKNIQRSPSPV